MKTVKPPPPLTAFTMLLVVPAHLAREAFRRLLKGHDVGLATWRETGGLVAKP